MPSLLRRVVIAAFTVTATATAAAAAAGCIGSSPAVQDGVSEVIAATV
jgi:hypothetical protein